MVPGTLTGSITHIPEAEESAFTRDDDGIDWDLDVKVIEVTDPEHLIRMTDDGCNSTCGTACNSCPAPS
jgi:FxLD family lantipeptide